MSATPPARARATTLTRNQTAARAAYVLAGNDRGRLTVAAPQLYPHMWSWDAAFIAIGLARVSTGRALTELETLLGAQWRTGMVPHIVFTEGETGYEPGPQRWACGRVCPDAPQSPATSGLIQPPVHGVAVRRILDAARGASAAERHDAVERIRAMWPRLLAWHRYLADRRDPEGRGLLTIYHGWESGLDDSPRWDAPYADVVPAPEFVPFRRADLHALGALGGAAAQRPSDAEYVKYQWLVEELRRARYDDATACRTLSFRMADVLTSALFVAANEELATVADELGLPGVDELIGYADRFRRGVLETADDHGFAADVDLRTGAVIRTPTIAGFAPLLSGGLDPARQQALVETLTSADWCGHPGFAHALPPSTSPSSPAFDPVRYWRGPQWPPVTWLLIWGLERSGEQETARALREAALDQLADGLFAEYYHPFTGEPLGARPQSWTAAVALDLLA
ncbi:glucosylglycerate hydrolase [Thermomonospora cellulosilytica]|uniref:Glycogen debranching enzyme n=1 Tax=Thermomonospora cellulosilytica TaxID=1411118 RepID=A0A7W3RA50_9ACTN|nr:glycogen debranching protein [Thermomonospora cellulosilytica]MBA9004935.1 glycogen debranching enzyme [Thermomonospora cellulosilytica]